MIKMITLLAAVLAPATAFAIHSQPTQAEQLALAHVNLLEVGGLMDLLEQVQRRLFHVEAMRQEIQTEVGESRCRQRSLDQWIKTGKSDQKGVEDLRELAGAVHALQIDLEGSGPAYSLRHNLKLAERKMQSLLTVVSLKSCRVSIDSRKALGAAMRLLKDPLSELSDAINEELAREARARIVRNVSPETRQPW